VQSECRADLRDVLAHGRGMALFVMRKETPL
jgi:hypothetical protein